MYNGTSVKGMSAPEVAAILKHYGLKKARQLTPENLESDAVSPSHPLHHYFEWDAEVGAKLNRIQQARVLIASIIYLQDDGSKHRMFHNIMDDKDGNPTVGFHATESKYIDIDDIMSDERLRDRMLSNAKNDLMSFKQKYATLSELVDVFKAIDGLK